MVRAPCCEKMGLKKGPWSPEEDQILVTFIQQHGHGNWRALPKQAGLLRCGKSCRLRWTNYLRPDIKRGNFTKEEEETIVTLHQLLGNRWSAIAARLPGRTDNEIKNVWHTHLKKKLTKPTIDPPNSDKIRVSSPQHDCSTTSTDMSSSLTDDVKKAAAVKKEEQTDYSSSEYFPQIDDTFWSLDRSHAAAVRCPNVKTEVHDAETPLMETEEWRNDKDTVGSMDFWYNLFIRAGDLPEF